MQTAKLEQLATSAAEEARASWVALVVLALALNDDQVESASVSLAKHMGQSKDNLRRKIRAIRYAQELGHSCQEIQSAGQENILSRFIKKTNSDRYEKTTVLKFNLPGSLREVIRKDFAQVNTILGFVTSEQLFDFLHSILIDLIAHPDELQHLAGELKGRDGKQ